MMLLFAIFIIFGLLVISISVMVIDNNTFAQVQQQQQQQQPTLKFLDVKVTSPTQAQQVPMGNLTIFGTSTDDASTDCEVYANRNGLSSPFQKVSATGPGGQNDYSNWTFTYVAPQASITEGNTNELTVKLSCFNKPANLTVFYAVNVTGMSSDSSGLATSAAPSPLTNGTTGTGPLSPFSNLPFSSTTPLQTDTPGTATPQPDETTTPDTEDSDEEEGPDVGGPDPDGSDDDQGPDVDEPVPEIPTVDADVCEVPPDNFTMTCPQ